MVSDKNATLFCEYKFRLAKLLFEMMLEDDGVARHKWLVREVRNLWIGAEIAGRNSYAHHKFASFQMLSEQI